MIAPNVLMIMQSVKLIVNTIRADLVERDREACANADECCFSSEDCKEASTAFMEKRKRLFKVH